METKWYAVLQASQIAEDLICFNKEDSAETCFEELETNGFDVAGVRDKSGAVIGYVKKAELNDHQTCDEATTIFLLGELAPGDMPLVNLFHKLAVEREYVFLLGHHGVQRILTRADLRKQPVKAMLYSLVCELEHTLSNEVKSAGIDIGACLTEDRLGAARKLQAERKKRREELGLVEYLQLCDKLTLLFKADLLGEWFNSGTSMRKWAGRLQALRNNLAHAHDPDNGIEWSEIAKIVKDTLEMQTYFSAERN